VDSALTYGRCGWQRGAVRVRRPTVLFYGGKGRVCWCEGTIWLRRLLPGAHIPPVPRAWRYCDIHTGLGTCCGYGEPIYAIW